MKQKRLNRTESLMFEPLEGRCLMSGTVSADVLGIAPPASPALIQPAILQWTPGPLLFATLPVVTGTYSGAFTDTAGNQVGGISLSVTSQTAKTFSGTGTISFFNGSPSQNLTISGHVNRHGAFLFHGSISGLSISAMGHLNHLVTLVRKGIINVNSVLASAGTFSLVKTS